MDDRINVALIYGSTRAGRFCDTVATWAGAQIWDRAGFTVDMIDPAALALPWRHEANDTDELSALRRRLDDADAFIVVTPEYNHSFPAALKFVIDSANEEWHAKPVGFVSYGGISGGLRAVEQLRLVFAELHAVGIRDSVSFANVWNRFDDHGELPASDPAHGPMRTMLGRLHWWAVALRDARQARPYLKRAA